MEGKLGAIYIGDKQVAGFLDWHVRLNMVEGVEDDYKTQKLQSWRIIAWAYWITRQIPPGSAVKVRLCADTGRAYWEGTGKVASRLTETTGTLVHVQLEVIGDGVLEAKELPDEE